MELIYKRATLEDLDVLTETRIRVLRAANKLSDDVDMTEVRNVSYQYYRQALKDDSHIAYLVFDDEMFVGAGGISFFQVMPTFHNPTGKKAYIMNMYTKPEYRRKGIATALTSNLAVEILNRGKVPFYCCAWSNIRSSRNAIKSGFLPAWVEMTVKPREIVDEMNLNNKIFKEVV